MSIISVRIFAQAPLITYPSLQVKSTTGTRQAVTTGNITSGNNSTGAVLHVDGTGLLPPAVITFTGFQSQQADANGNITPIISSTNTDYVHSPIILTSVNTQIATITATGLIHLTGIGLDTIIATQAGNEFYSDAAPVYIYLTVYRNPHFTFPPLPTKTICDVGPDFPANVTSDGPAPITYTSDNINVATVSAQGKIHISGAGRATITASQDSANYYAAASQSQLLIVTGPVNPTIHITPVNYSTCNGATVTYTANVTNEGSNPLYMWKVNNISSGITTPTFTSSSLHTNDVITCTVTNTTDCSTVPAATASTTIIVRPNVDPAIQIASSASMPVCAGAPITFYAISNITPGADYQWMVNGIPSGTNQSIFTSTGLNNGDIVTCNLTAQASACVTASTAVSNGIPVGITPNELPLVTVTPSASKVYSGTAVSFTVAVTNITATPNYQWQINHTNVGTNSAEFATDELRDGDLVTCTITSTTGCVAPTTSLPVIMTVMPPPTVKINNTFTPNADGINDRWNIPDLQFYPHCLVNIFDRSGAQLYQARGYDKPWDGTFGGRQLPTGTYYYIIRLGPQSQTLSGSVTIIR